MAKTKKRILRLQIPYVRLTPYAHNLQPFSRLFYNIYYWKKKRQMIWDKFVMFDDDLNDKTNRINITIIHLTNFIDRNDINENRINKKKKRIFLCISCCFRIFCCWNFIYIFFNNVLNHNFYGSRTFNITLIIHFFFLKLTCDFLSFLFLFSIHFFWLET